MAGGKKGGSREPGPHVVNGGRVVAASCFSNDSGAGTPPAPGRRGEAFGENVMPPGLGKAPGKARVFEHLRRKGGKS